MKIRIVLFLILAALFWAESETMAQAAEEPALEDGNSSRIMDLENELYLLQEKIDSESEKRQNLLEDIKDQAEELRRQEEVQSEVQEAVDRLDRELLETDEVVYSIRNNYSQVIEDMDKLRSRLEGQKQEFAGEFEDLEEQVDSSLADLQEFKEDIQVQMNAVNDALGSGMSGMEKKLVQISDEMEEREERFKGLKADQNELQGAVQEMQKKIGRVQEDLQEFRRRSTGRQDKMVLLLQKRVLIWGGVVCGVLLVILLALAVRTLRLEKKLRDFSDGRDMDSSAREKDGTEDDDQALGWLEKQRGPGEE
ncbi:MAG: hypothetical protein ACLFSY_01275 [Desulfonatronovibrionaceae bacterium]